jgi:hypothetical protein
MVSLRCALSLGSWTAVQVFDLRAIRHEPRVIRPGREWSFDELRRALCALALVRAAVRANLLLLCSVAHGGRRGIELESSTAAAFAVSWRRWLHVLKALLARELSPSVS